MVFFRQQQLSDEDLVRFTAYFGKPVPHVRKQRPRRVKEIFLISNVKENGEPIGDRRRTDALPLGSFLPAASRHPLSALRGGDPSQGGQTQWCNCTAAYEALDDVCKTRLKGMRAVHRHYVEAQNPPEHIAHPIVRTIPKQVVARSTWGRT